MKLIYILLPNDSCSTSIPDSIDNESLLPYLLSNCKINSITPNSLTLDYNSTTYSLSTLLQYESQTNTIYLTFEINTDTQDKSASIINYLRTEISNLPRDSYYIICSLDESSEYYCNKIYSLFNSCERRLRSITYSFITKAFGYKWFDQTFDDDQKDGLKGKIKVKQKSQRTIALIENSLYELTWFELIDYLFKVQTYKNLDTTLTQDFLKTKSTEDLLEIIEQCRPQTKWEKYIMPLPKDFPIQETLNTLRIHRNNVAHNKIFTQDDYIYCNSQLPKLISLIDIGDAKLKDLLFTPEQQTEIIYDTCSAFSNMAKSLSDISTTLSETMKATGLFASQLTSMTSLASSATYPAALVSSLSNMSKTLSETMKATGISASQLTSMTSLASSVTYPSALVSSLSDMSKTLYETVKATGLSASQLTSIALKED